MPETTVVKVEIARDFWDSDGERQPAGTVIEVPVDVALMGVETGALRRVRDEPPAPDTASRPEAGRRR